MSEEISKPKGKHKKFADLYLKYMNGTRAYLETYPNSDYNSAMANSSRLIRNDKVAAYIQEKLKEFQMDAEEALRRMSDIARGDMADIMDVSSVGWALDMKKAQERGKTGLIKKVKQTTITKIGRKQDDDDEERTYLEVELYPADVALRDILKVHGKFVDRTEITGKDGEALQIGVKVIDYRHSIATLAPRPVPNSDTPGENQDPDDGSALGQDGTGRSADNDGTE